TILLVLIAVLVYLTYLVVSPFLAPLTWALALVIFAYPLHQRVVAWPADYGNSGVMTFLINQDGIVYEKDLGEETEALASQMKDYNPDETWSKAE
ncbi:MAG: DUF2950 family protein, partial [Candidatus Acidiferrales bacterium]